MPEQRLGKLEEVELRSVWGDEARDFTPWVADHLDELGAALHLDLELVEAEGAVGSFSADVIAEADGKLVIIENQLEQTDHGHLGQLLTYAAGRDAQVLIWITPQFRDEHRAAVDWLNRWTSDEIEAYGVEVRAVRIGDSLTAPEFRAMAFPNHWSRQSRSRDTGGWMSDDERSRRIDFFDELARKAVERKLTNSTGMSAVAKSKSFPSRVGGREFRYWIDLPKNGGITAKLDVRTEDTARNADILEALIEDREDIERELGFEPEWIAPDPHGPHGRVAGEVTVRRGFSIEDSSKQFTQAMNWALDVIEGFQSALEPRLIEIVENLQAEQTDGVAD